MSGRRNQPHGRARQRPGRVSPQDCYASVDESSEDRPAFDTTPFDSSSGESAWATLPTESIFSSSDSACPSSPDWRSSPYPNSVSSRRYHSDSCEEGPVTAAGYSGTASPLYRRALMTGIRPAVRSTPLFSSGGSPPYSPHSSPSWSDPSAFESSGRSAGSSGLSQFTDGSPGAFDSQLSDCDDDDDYKEFYSYLHQPPAKRPIKVDTSPLPSWKPKYASERLEDPNNPPPMFHPLLDDRWKTDPNVSEDLHNLYTSSVNRFSPNFGIYEYGRLSEYNPQNVYDPERFAGVNDQGSPTPAPMEDCGEAFGDPEEALARSTEGVPDKFRKEKWRYFEVKKRLELFKKLGMENELDMYKGQLERMEADPWTGDDSGSEVVVYRPGTEGDPAYDDELLEKMEALVHPDNPSLKSFYAAMANPPAIRDECTTSDEEASEVMDMLHPNQGGIEGIPIQGEECSTDVSNMEGGLAGLSPATLNSSDDGEMDASFLTCDGFDDSQLAGEEDSPDAGEMDASFHTCVGFDDSLVAGNDSNESCAAPDSPLNTTFSLDDENSPLNTTFCLDDEDSPLNTTFSLDDEDSPLNTTFTISEGPSSPFSEGIGPDGC